MNIQDYLQSNSQASLARILGVSQMMVSHWYTHSRKITGVKVISISKATNWQVTPHELRPDLYPHPHDGLPESMRCPCIEKAA